MRASFSIVLGSAVVVLATAAALTHYDMVVDAMPQYGATTQAVTTGYNTGTNTGYNTGTVANTGYNTGTNTGYNTGMVANTGYNTGVGGTTTAVNASPCAGLFTQGNKLVFTQTGTSNTFAYSQGTTCSQFPQGFSTTFFLDSGCIAPQNQWTVDVAGCSGTQFRLQSDQGQYLAVCDTKKMTGSPLSGHYPQLNPTAGTDAVARSKSLWQFNAALNAPVCRVSIQNMYSNMRITICTQAQCGVASGGPFAGKCPAVIGCPDDSITFDVTVAGAAAQLAGFGGFSKLIGQVGKALNTGYNTGVLGQAIGGAAGYNTGGLGGALGQQLGGGAAGYNTGAPLGGYQ